MEMLGPVTFWFLGINVSEARKRFLLTVLELRPDYHLFVTISHIFWGFVVGILLSQVRSKLPWADGKLAMVFKTFLPYCD